MGVLNCGRRKCSNIMCDRYNPVLGYLCDSCFKELVSHGTDICLEEFMKGTPKTEDEMNCSEEYYNDIFRRQ